MSTTTIVPRPIHSGRQIPRKLGRVVAPVEEEFESEKIDDPPAARAAGGVRGRTALLPVPLVEST